MNYEVTDQAKPGQLDIQPVAGAASPGEGIEEVAGELVLKARVLSQDGGGARGGIDEGHRGRDLKVLEESVGSCLTEESGALRGRWVEEE